MWSSFPLSVGALFHLSLKNKFFIDFFSNNQSEVSGLFVPFTKIVDGLFSSQNFRTTVPSFTSS